MLLARGVGLKPGVTSDVSGSKYVKSSPNAPCSCAGSNQWVCYEHVGRNFMHAKKFKFLFLYKSYPKRTVVVVCEKP